MPMLRSGISGMAPQDEFTPQEHEKKPAPVPATVSTESDSADGSEAGSGECPCCDNPEPESELGVHFDVLDQPEKQIVLHFLSGNFNFPDKCPELFERMAESTMGKIWAQKLVDYHYPSLKNLDELDLEPAKKRPKTVDLEALDETKGLAMLRRKLNSKASCQLSVELAEEAQNNLGRALWRLSGPAMQFLHRFISTSLASERPEGESRSPFTNGDGLISEMRVTLSLIARLEAERGPANGGLLLPSILLQHSRSAMNAAWRILATLATAGSQRDSLLTWQTVVADVKKFLWHATAVFGSEFTLIIRAESWLADANGPRTERSTIGDRFSALRDLLFPTDPAELGNPDAYEAYGLREVDAVEFSTLENATAQLRAPSPPNVLPLAIEPTGENKDNPQPDLWVQAQIKRMAQDENLACSSTHADYFMSHI
jgi:hypothetical protein